MSACKDCATCKHQPVMPWETPCNACMTCEKWETAEPAGEVY